MSKIVESDVVKLEEVVIIADPIIEVREEIDVDSLEDYVDPVVAMSTVVQVPVKKSIFSKAFLQEVGIPALGFAFISGLIYLPFHIDIRNNQYKEEVNKKIVETKIKYADINKNGFIDKDEEKEFWERFALKNNLFYSPLNGETEFDPYRFIVKKSVERINRKELYEMLKNYKE